MANLFNVYLYQPILSVLIFIYENLSFHNLGIAIIILTVFIRVVLFPLFYKSAKDQSLMARIQPKIKKIQEDLKHNKEEQTKALLSLYKEHRLNPFSGLFLVLIQLPILIALYRVFLRELGSSVFDNKLLFGLNLGEKSLIIALIAAALQYFQGKLALPKKDKKTVKNDSPMASMGKTMVYIGPFLTVMILAGLPAALGVYWATSTLFSVGQQVYINAKLNEKTEENGQSSRENK